MANEKTFLDRLSESLKQTDDSMHAFVYGKQPEYSRPMPQPAEGMGARIGQGIGIALRPDTLRAVVGPLVGAQKEDYGDLGLLRKTYGLPAQLVKLLGAGLGYGYENIRSGYGAEPPIRQPTKPAAQPTGKEDTQATPTTDVDVPTEQGGSDGMDSLFQLDSIIEKRLRNPQDQKMARAHAAAKLLKKGSPIDRVMLGMWVESGSGAFQSMLEAQTKIATSTTESPESKEGRASRLESQRSANDLYNKTVTNPEAALSVGGKAAAPRKFGIVGSRVVDPTILRSEINRLYGATGGGSSKGLSSKEQIAREIRRNLGE